jgi:hypothetical protein
MGERKRQARPALPDTVAGYFLRSFFRPKEPVGFQGLKKFQADYCPQGSFDKELK